MCSFSCSLTFGMECNARIDSSKESLFVEKISIQRYNSFQKKKLKVKVEILLQYACDIKSWLGPKPLVSS